MKSRPTPRDLADGPYLPRGVAPVRLAFLIELEHHGYVLVHPDDHPRRALASHRSGPAWANGWNACRRSVFGGGA